MKAHLVRVLSPIWKTITVTAQRVRGRIEIVLGSRDPHSKFRHGDNPARWRHHLEILLGGGGKTVEHHAALPFAEAPGIHRRATQSARHGGACARIYGPDSGANRRSDRREMVARLISRAGVWVI